MEINAESRSKLGLFVGLIIILLAIVTVRISQTSLFSGSTYDVYVLVENAVGINNKTPVQIAGIQVGTVSDIELVDNNKARLKLEINSDVKLSSEVEAHIKTLGFLGDTYIDLYQRGLMTDVLKPESTIKHSQMYGDMSSVTGQISAIAEDVKAVTTTLRELMAGQDSAFAKSIKNIEKITNVIGDVSTRNQGNMNAIIANLKALSENLNMVVARNMGRIDNSMTNVDAITGQVRSGQGTLGKLVYDDSTIEKVNDSLDNLNELLGDSKRLQVDIGYHTEYLSNTEDFKHYVELGLKPSPDKTFLFEFVDDPAPDSNFTVRETQITSGGTTNTITEQIKTTDEDKFRFSAQLAKEWNDFTLRGGIIESSGGVGVDYNKGPVGLKLSAFDFETKRGEKPHLKAMGTLNVTQGIYLIGGVDDFISNEQDPDWFLGAGIKVTDDDLKSLMGLLSVKP